MNVKHPYRMMIGGLIGLSLLLQFGCQQKSDVLHESDNALYYNVPLNLRINNESQVRINGEWFDVYGQRGSLQDYFKRRAARYKEGYIRMGIPLQEDRVGGRVVTLLPDINVNIEIEHDVKKGSKLRTVRRMCREAGFIRFNLIFLDENGNERGRRNSQLRSPNQLF